MEFCNSQRNAVKKYRSRKLSEFSYYQYELTGTLAWHPGFAQHFGFQIAVLDPAELLTLELFGGLLT